MRAKKRLNEGEASIVVFGVEATEETDEEELTLVDLDQKDEKKVEEGVEEAAVACESVGESNVDETSPADFVFTAESEGCIPVEGGREISESFDALRETALRDCACAGVEVDTAAAS